MKALLGFFAGLVLGFIARTLARSFTGLLLTAAAVIAVAGILTDRTEISLLSIPLILIARRGG
jgi:hypothetical protein